MARKKDGLAGELFELLSLLPWWVSIALGVGWFVALRYWLPGLADRNLFWRMWGALFSQFAWLSVFMLVPAATSVYNTYRKRRILDRQKGIQTIRDLSWKEFEELLGEAFRRQGYTVRENARGGPDGGIDLEIERDGNVTLVQCKHWQSAKVGVKVVREMLGLVTAHGAHGGIIVASGLFTQEARALAADKPIDLIEGSRLVQMLASVQDKSQPRASEPVQRSQEPDQSKIPPKVGRCPSCGGELVMRTARRGPNAGRQFWGCSSYPRCRHIEEIGV